MPEHRGIGESLELPGIEEPWIEGRGVTKPVPVLAVHIGQCHCGAHSVGELGAPLGHPRTRVREQLDRAMQISARDEIGQRRRSCSIPQLVLRHVLVAKIECEPAGLRAEPLAHQRAAFRAAVRSNGGREGH